MAVVHGGQTQLTGVHEVKVAVEPTGKAMVIKLEPAMVKKLEAPV